MIPKRPDYQCPVCRKICYDYTKRHFRWEWYPCDRMIGVAVTLCPHCEQMAAEEAQKVKAGNLQSA